MKTIGLFLILLGGSSYLMPMIHMRNLIMSQFGEHEKIAAPIIIVVGVIVLVLGMRKKKKDEKK